MPERPKYSRWRRLPEVFRSAEFKLPDPSQQEQLLSLYIPGWMLDQADAQASRVGVPTVQEYCAELLMRAISGERAKAQVEEIEARRGTFEGLHEIASDPEYLAEWSAQNASREASALEAQEAEADGSDRAEALGAPTADSGSLSVEMPVIPDRVPLTFRSPVEVVLRHAGLLGEEPNAFLPSLRRGEAPPMANAAELAQALQTLEESLAGAESIDRRLAYALHRLSFESQILHTDAWPGTFDEWTVEAMRAIQEYVDRILSGQDIRYYPSSAPPETPL